MTRDEMYRYFGIVEAIKEGRTQVTELRDYSAREIGDAVNDLIQSAVREAVQREREACAMVAEAAGEPVGFLARGQQIEADPVRKRICIEVAGLIRTRR